MSKLHTLHIQDGILFVPDLARIVAAIEGLFQGLATDALNIYGRAVLPPRKRKSHVILDLCTNRGELETLTITKKYNRIVPLLYRRSRKLKWGGLWPDLSPKQRVNAVEEPDDDGDEDIYTI